MYVVDSLQRVEWNIFGINIPFSYTKQTTQTPINNKPLTKISLKPNGTLLRHLKT